MQVLTEWVEPGAAMIRTDAAGKQNAIRRPNTLPPFPKHTCTAKAQAGPS